MPAVRRPSLTAIRAVTFVAATAALLTLGAPSPTRAAEHAVQIADSAFSPATMTISVGDTVTWTNADGRPHTVTSDGGAFDSGNLDEGQAFSFTFSEPGTYTYHCNYHGEMQATIVVEAASAPAAAPSQAAGGTASGGTDAQTAAGGGTAATTTHAAGTHEGAQPDTALELPVSLPWLAPLLIGLGLVALAFGVIPPTREPVQTDTSSASGWRR
jgi:plastocyanin